MPRDGRGDRIMQAQAQGAPARIVWLRSAIMRRNTKVAVRACELADVAVVVVVVVEARKPVSHARVRLVAQPLLARHRCRVIVIARLRAAAQVAVVVEQVVVVHGFVLQSLGRLLRLVAGRALGVDFDACLHRHLQQRSAPRIWPRSPLCRTRERCYLHTPG